eukprot:gene7605-9350_t
MTDLQWFPNKLPIYDINKSWEYNLENGPFVDGYNKVERRFKNKEDWLELFPGIKVASPLGVPAGPLLNSNWIKFAADAGFDVVTYKTIRSKPNLGHPVPNILYIDSEMAGKKNQTAATSTTVVPKSMEELAITNSFGMPSKDAEYLHKDIRRANELLLDGQLMIVSVVGTACSAHDFLQDIIDTAVLAADAGAKVVEINYSCPNVVTGEGQIYHNPEAVYEISSALVNILKPRGIPLVIKVGVMDDQSKMEKLFEKAENAGVSAIAGINTLSMQITDPVTHQPSLGPNRLTSGVCGAPIRNAALDWVKSARSILKKRSNTTLKLLSCGGVVEPDHFTQFLNAGADIAMSATGLMWDPYIAMKWHQKNY